MRRTDPENSNKRYFRTQERVFAMNGQWYFAAREGEVGPFSTRKRALEEVARYAQERQDLESFQRARQGETEIGSGPALSIVPKEEEADLTLDDLLLEIQR